MPSTTEETQPGTEETQATPQPETEVTQPATEETQQAQSESGKTPESETTQQAQPESGKAPESETTQQAQPESGKMPESETTQQAQPESGKTPESETTQQMQPESGKTPESETTQQAQPESEEITYQVKFDAHAADFGTVIVDEQMIDPNSYVKEAAENSEYVFRIEAANGYEVENVRANDTELIEDESPDKYRITAVTEDTVITVVYREAPEESENVVQHVVTFQTGEGAIVTVDGTDATNGTAMAKDGRIVFTVAAQEGFTVTEVLVDGTIPARTTGNPDEYIIEGIQTDATVVAVNTASAQTEETETEETEMPVTENLVTFQSAEGATVIVDGTDVTNGTASAKNGTIIFTAAPTAGFRISEVLVDGEVPARETGNTGEYIIEGIATDDTVVIVNTAPTEEKEDEATQEQEKPAQTMTVTASDGATVIITAPQGALPEGAQVIAQAISSASIESAVADAVASEGKTLVDYKAYDITIIDGEGNVIQPDASVQVTINNAGVAGEETAVYHVEGASADKIAEVPGGDYAAFAAAHFSIYVVAGSQTEQPEANEVLVTYRRIRESGVAVEPPYTVAYDLKDGGIQTEYQAPPEAGYTISMEADAAHFTFDEGSRTVIGNFTESGSYEVVLTYTPKTIRYSVTHKYQSLDGSYDKDTETETLTGKVNTMTDAQERPREGFTVKPIEQIHIAPNAKDDAINVEVEYNRNECLLIYNTMGGSYIESEILLYGTTIDLQEIERPVREGYRFTGWYSDKACQNKITEIEVTEQTTYVYAGWTGAEVDYKVVYMQENADDDGYSYAGSVDLRATAGSTVEVTADTKKPTGFDTGHFTFKEGETGEIMPDGSTVLIAYYSRNVYKITFTARKLACGQAAHTHAVTNGADSCYKLTCQQEESSWPWGHHHSVKNGCYALLCDKTEHQHEQPGRWNPGCYGDEITKTIEAKYEQDISELWNETVGPGTDLEGYNWLWQEGTSSYDNKYTGFQTTMPGEDKILDETGNAGTTVRPLCYYIEDPNGTVAYGNDGLKFSLYTKVVLYLDSGANPTYDEEFFVIDGYDRYASTISAWSGGQNGGNPDWDRNGGGTFYYKRADYELELISDGNSSKHELPYLSDIENYLAAPQNGPEGATFGGWYLDPEFTTPFETAGAKMPKGLSLYAKWIPATHTVTFYDRGNVYLEKKIVHGQAIIEGIDRPSYEKDYIFDGWYTTEDCQEGTDFDFAKPVVEDTKVYAKWTPITDTTYTVRYLTEGGRPVADEVHGSGTVGETVRVEAVKPRDQYASYTVDEATKDFTLTADPKQNIIIFTYSQTSDLKYTIHYVDEGQVIYKRENIPSEANHLIVHPEADDLEALDALGYKVIDHHKEVDLTTEGENIVTFECEKAEYTITYEGLEGSDFAQSNPNPATYRIDTPSFTLQNPTKIGAAFDGWVFDTSTGGIVLNNDHNKMQTVISTGSHGDLTFTATWREKTYTVAYDTNGGTPETIESKTVGWNSSGLLPEITPTKTGYTFKEWTYQNAAVTPDKTYASLAGTDDVVSITLTAQWTEDPSATVHVDYVADPATGGSVSNIAGDTIQIITANGLRGATAMAAEGYTFIGWFNGETKLTDSTVLTPGLAKGSLNKDPEDQTYTATTFTAKFTENENVTLTYTVNPSESGTVSRGSESIAPVTGVPRGSYASANPGYKFVNWTVGSDVAGKNQRLTAAQVANAAKKGGVYTSTEFVANFELDASQTVQVNYQADPAAGGTLDQTSNTIQIVEADGLTGSTAAASNGYKFVGWFKEGAETPITTTQNLSVQTAKDNLNVDAQTGRYAATNFIAKFAADETKTAKITYQTQNETMGTVTVSDEDVQVITGNKPSGETLSGSAAIVNKGYKFIGWYKGDTRVSTSTALTGRELKRALNKEGDLYTDTTFVARFDYDDSEASSATITYVSQNENMGTVAPSSEQIHIVPAKPGNIPAGSTATPKAGYKFDGWYKGDTLVGSAVTLTPKEVQDNLNKDAVSNTYTDTTFEARFSLDENAKATATYRTADRTMGRVSPTSSDFQIVDAQGLAGSTATPRNGYRFVGWYLGDDMKTPISEDKNLTAETAKENLNKNEVDGTYTDTTFTARFVIDPTQTVKVFYKPESQEMGSVTPSEKEIPIRDASGLTDAVATPEPGYVFTGWYLTDSIKVCDTPTLDAETARKYLLKAADGSYRETTFWASFADASDVTLMYLPNPLQGGTTTPGHENLAPATGQAKGSVATPNNGYKFINWTTANGDVAGEALTLTGAEVDKWAKTEEDIYETKVFRANFAIDEDQTATVTYTAETGGSVDNPSDTIQIVTGDTLNGSTAAAAKGYRFVGWYKGEEQISRELTLTPDDAEAELERNEDQTYKDTTFTAKFEPDPRQWVTVSYQSEDDKKGTVDRVSDFIQIVTGETLNGSTATAKPGYKFIGWYKDGAEDPFTTEAALTADIIKKADALDKDADGTYTATTFTAKFAYDETQEVPITYVSSDERRGTVSNPDDTIQIVPGNPDASIDGSAATAVNGYKFVGWYKGQTRVSTQKQLTADVVKGALNKDQDGNYAATTFTAVFDYDETALATITYKSEDTDKGTVNNAKDTIQIVPDYPNPSIKGSTATPADGYKFDGWYVGDKKIGGAPQTLDLNTVKANLGKDDAGMYQDTEFTAKFVIDETQTAKVYYLSGDKSMGSVSLAEEDVQIVTGDQPSGEKLQGSTAIPVPGYKFDGWCKTTEGMLGDLVPVTSPEQLSGETAKQNLNVQNGRYADTAFWAFFTEKDNVTLKYVADPAEGGTLTQTLESLPPATGSAKGSKADPAAGYKFINWTVGETVVSEDAELTKAEVDAVAKKNGAYEAVTFTANFAIDESQTVDVTYKADPAEGGTVSNDKDTIQIVTGETLTGSTAQAVYGYRFVGWYKDGQSVTTNAELTTDTVLGFLEKPDGKTYEAAEFIAKFEIDPTQTKDLSATVDYMLADDVQTADHVELNATVQVLEDDTLSTSGVSARAYAGWKLEKITVNDTEVEELPAEVPDKAKVIYHYTADFTGLDAAGFEEFYNGQTHQVSVTGALESDVIRYYAADTDTVRYAAMTRSEIQNAFVNVSDSASVMVEVIRGSNKQTWTKQVDAVVKPVDVELTADSAQKVYDGTPLTVGTYKITSGAFVADEGLESVTVEGSQTYAGSSKAEITKHTFKNNTLSENYNIICRPGTLTVTAEGADPDDIMTKTHEGKKYGLGDEITFTIRVKNIYDKICDITIIEQQGVKITGESKFTDVKPGEEVSTTAVYTVTEADLLAGKFTNTVIAKIDEHTHTATDTTDTFEDLNGHLTVSKKSTSTPKDGAAYTPGEKITYEITVKNDGNLTQTEVVVRDELTDDIWMIEALKPGESKTFTAEYVVTEEDTLKGTVKNVAVATSKSPDPDQPTPSVVPGETEDPIVAPKESLWLEKKVDSDKDEFKVGEVVPYTIRVVNNGNVTLTDVEVRDPLTDDVWTIESLAPGASKEFRAEYEVTEKDASAGEIVNTATVVGEAPAGDAVRTDDTAIVTAEPAEPIEEPQTEPQTEAQKEAPKTGDETDIAKWLLMMTAAAGVLLAGAASRRRRRS